MRSKGAEAASTLEGDPPEDEGGISSSVPSGGISQWVSNTTTAHTSADMLFVNLEETYPPSPPFLERDPNMSSAARYSPLHGTPATLTTIPPLQHTPLLQTYQVNNNHHTKSISTVNTNIECNDNRNILNVGAFSLSANNNTNGPQIDDIHPTDINQYMGTYSDRVDVSTVNNNLLSERLAPLLNAIDDVTCSDDAVQHETNEGFYSQQVYTSGDGFGVSSSSEGAYLPANSSTVNTLSSATEAQMLDAANDMQLVFSTDGEFHMIGGNGMKTDRVELLITGGQPGISYSLSKENGFIIARPTDSPCNSVKSELIKYEPQDVNMSVLTTLEDSSGFKTEPNTIENENGNLDLAIPQNNQNSATNISVENIENEESHTINSFDIANYFNEDENMLPSNNRRGRKQPPDTDMSITCIPDKSVPCRAKASLPASHLWLCNSDENGSHVLGVFARRRIPVRARFGPIEGVRKILPQGGSSQLTGPGPHFLIHTEDGDYSIDVSDEKTSNWMRYVRFSPGAYQNICLQQLDDSLFFTSSKPIAPQSELLLGYGATYARHWGLPCTEQSDEEPIDWPCFECPLQFASSPELQKHLNSHDEIEKSSSLRRVKKKNTVKNSDNHCAVCNRTFPRSYSLKRHMKTHVNILTTDLESQSQVSKRVSQKPKQTNGLVEEEAINILNNSIDEKGQDSSIQNLDASQNKWENDDDQINSDDSSSKNDVILISNNQTCGKSSSIDNSTIQNQECMECTSNNLENDVCVHTKINQTMQMKNDAQWNLDCLLCSESFDHPTSLTEHIQIQHKKIDGSFDCHLCEKNFSDLNGIRKHLHGSHNIQKYNCKECPANFDTADKLLSHMLKHTKITTFICPSCKKQFKRKDKLKEHIRRQQRFINNNKEAIYLCVERSSASLSSPQDDPSAYLSFTFKCHPCRLGFKRRGMLVNHLARRHPEVSRASVPELQLPIMKTARDYYCQHCDKVYKSSSKRKAHILKNHPGESLPPSSRDLGGTESNEIEVLGYSACVGAVSSSPHHCPYTPCHKQYASKAKLSQHIRHKHLPAESKENSNVEKVSSCCDLELNNSHRFDGISTNDIHMYRDHEIAPLMNDQLMNENTYAESADTNIVSSSGVKIKRPLPPLQRMSPFNKNINNKPLMTSDNQGLLHSFANEKGQNIESKGFIDQNNVHEMSKPLIETKQDKSNDANQLVCKMSKSDWKNNSDPLTLFESIRNGTIRLIQIGNGVEIFDKTESFNLNGLEKDMFDKTVLVNEIPKLHISGHILSMEANKLPPMSVLSKNTTGGNSLTTQYTDR